MRPLMDDLAALAARLGAAWGPLANSPELVVNRENAVFDLRLRSGERGALRLHRSGYQTAESIRSELLWTERLAVAGFLCPTPLRTSDGALIVQHAGQPIASLIRWVEAVPIGAMGGTFRDAPRSYREVGALIGRLHSLTDHLDLADITRPDWSRETLLGDHPAWGRFWENQSLSKAETDLLIAARDAASQAMLEMSNPDIGLIHADVLQENILRNSEGLWLIDFDDAGVGYRLYDLGTALIQHIDDHRYVEISAALAEGYTSARGRPVAASDLELFTMLRGLASCGWVMTRAAATDPRQRIYAERALKLARAFLG